MKDDMEDESERPSKTGESEKSKTKETKPSASQSVNSSQSNVARDAQRSASRQIERSRKETPRENQSALAGANSAAVRMGTKRLPSAKVCPSFSKSHFFLV